MIICPFHLETSVMVVTCEKRSTDNGKLIGKPILCYFPGEGMWCKLGEMPPDYGGAGEFIFCRGKLHLVQNCSIYFRKKPRFASYNPYLNCLLSEWPNRDFDNFWILREIFVVNEDVIYALVSKRRTVSCRVRSVSSITKDKEESNSWEDVTSFDHLDARANFCIVVKEDFVYFIGGEEWLVESHNEEVFKCYTDVHRYNLSRNQWDKVADFLRPKKLLSGAACNGRIFIAGLVTQGVSQICQSEVYSETTNEWQLIASLNISPKVCPKLLSLDDKLYALGSLMCYEGDSPSDTRVQCYDPDINEWIWKTDIPIQTRSNTRRIVNAYSARIFKGFLSNHQLRSINSRRCFFPASSKESSEGKCIIV